ncbi:MAG: Ig-like domain-containing protein, partial [Candidatus Kariarchaeaceae archaeon]
LLDNLIYNNTGIAVDITSDNNIFDNNFYNNTGLGLYISGSNNVISWNTFLDNAGGDKQAYANSDVNDFSYNHWNDHSSSDSENDGIVDYVYPVDCTICTGERDSTPLVDPYEWIEPTFNNPTGGTHEGTLNIQWDDTGDIFNRVNLYSLNYSNDAGQTWNILSPDISTENYVWDIKERANGSDYKVKVVFERIEGYQEEVVSDPFTIVNFAPDAPLNLLTNFNGIDVELTWESPSSTGSSAISEYKIYKSITPNNYSYFNSTSQTSYNDSTVTLGQIYYYKVSATNLIGEGANSTVQSIIPLLKPSSPRNLQDTLENEITQLIWDIPLDLGGSYIRYYLVYRGTSSGIYNQIANTTLTAYNDSSIDLKQTYYYAVTVVNQAGESNYSTEIVSHDNNKPIFTSKPLNDTINILSGKLNISVFPNDENGIEKVEIKLGTVNIATMLSSPYIYEFDTTQLLDGSNVLTIIVFDKAGNQESATYQLSIFNAVQSETTTSDTSTSETDTTDTSQGTSTTPDGSELPYLAEIIIGAFGIAGIGGVFGFRRILSKRRLERSIDELEDSYLHAEERKDGKL